MPTQPHDLIIIGGGQSGLAAAYHAKQKGLNYKVLEAGGAIGHSWRNRYDSLVLFTPRSYSALPGLPLSGNQNSYPSKDETATYLQQYAQQFDLNIALNEPVTKLTKSDDLFTTTTPQGAYQSKAVIVATGPFQTPRTPALAR